MQTVDTRQRILEQMFLDIRKNGFQGLRADKVIAEMDVTKGALYHYFVNKQAIGTAVLDEIIRPRYLCFYTELNQWQGNPIDKLQEHLQFLAEHATDEDVSLGCPLNNLIQEMSPLDEAFRLRMKAIIDAINTSVQLAIERGKAAGFVQQRVEPSHIAQFFFATIEGAYSLGKVRKDATAFKSNMETLAKFLDSLRT